MSCFSQVELFLTQRSVLSTMAPHCVQTTEKAPKPRDFQRAHTSHGRRRRGPECGPHRADFIIQPSRLPSHRSEIQNILARWSQRAGTSDTTHGHSLTCKPGPTSLEPTTIAAKGRDNNNDKHGIHCLERILKVLVRQSLENENKPMRKWM